MNNNVIIVDTLNKLKNYTEFYNTEKEIVFKNLNIDSSLNFKSSELVTFINCTFSGDIEVVNGYSGVVAFKYCKFIGNNNKFNIHAKYLRFYEPEFAGKEPLFFGTSARENVVIRKMKVSPSLSKEAVYSFRGKEGVYFKECNIDNDTLLKVKSPNLVFYDSNINTSSRYLISDKLSAVNSEFNFTPDVSSFFKTIELNNSKVVNGIGQNIILKNKSYYYIDPRLKTPYYPNNIDANDSVLLIGHAKLNGYICSTKLVNSRF